MPLTNAEVALSGAVEEAREAYSIRNPKSRALNERARRSLPGGSTRSSIYYSPFPLAFARGEGNRLWDADGHEYRDFLGEFTAGLYGHSDPRIKRAVTTALEEGILRGGPSHHEEALASVICERFPAVDSVRFCNSGTEANLFAVSAARAFTGREAVVVAEGAYHGGVFEFTHGSPLNLPVPFHKIPYNDPDTAAQVIGELGDELACVIIEPLMGAGGCIAGRPDFLETLRRESERVGALLIFDEVMTSRLGPGGLHGELGIRPDLVTFGKYMGGGLTFGAFGGRRDLMAKFDPRQPGAWTHPGTFNNNVLTMAAGLAGLTEVYPPEEASRFNAKCEGYRAIIKERIDTHELPIQLSGKGSMLGFHFSRRSVVARPQDSLASAPDTLRELLHLDLIEMGHYYARRGLLVMTLPVQDEDILALCGALDRVLERRADIIEANVQ